MLGGLFRYLRESDPTRFQPMNSNWGLVDPLSETVRDKRLKRQALADRAQADFLTWMAASRIGQEGPALHAAAAG
jgi:methylenetetrahydrofolate--tRNA-(uracil-5-)-methyltransferase